MQPNARNTFSGIAPSQAEIDDPARVTTPMYSMESIEEHLGTFSIMAPEVALGTQLHGDNTSEIFDRLIFNLESFLVDGIPNTSPGFMDKRKQWACLLRMPTTFIEQHSGGRPYSANKVVLAPPCFSLANKFEVGEQVLILPTRYVTATIVKHKLNISTPRNYLSYDFYIRGEFDDNPLFVLAKDFKVVFIGPTHPYENLHEYWPTYTLRHEGIKDFIMPPSMMCRKTELIPFLS